MISNYVYVNGERIAKFENKSYQNVDCYLTDHLGLVLAVVDYEGTVKVRNLYRPWGEKLNSMVTGGRENQFQYTSQYLDEDLSRDLAYYGHRYHDQGLKIFTSVDPLKYKYSAWGSYVYVLANPVKNIDPDGRGLLFQDWSLLGNSSYSGRNSTTGVAWGGFRGSLIWYGQATLRAGILRAGYIGAVRGAGESGTLRSDWKKQYRTITPEPYRSSLEAYRPIDLERAGIKFGPSASRTNLRIDRLGGCARIGGATMVGVSVGWSLYDIAVADNPWREAAGEAGGWAVALASAEIGCESCGIAFAWLGWGAAGGCVVGGVFFGGVGYYYGEGGVKQIYDWFGNGK